MARKTKKAAPTNDQGNDTTSIPSIQQMQPERLLTQYSKTGVVITVLVVVLLLHIVVLAATSPEYIRKMVDPEYAAEMAMLEEQRIESEKKDAQKAAQIDAQAAQREREAAAAENSEATENGDSQETNEAEQENDEAWKKTPIGREMTDVADPEELPSDMFDATFGE